MSKTIDDVELVYYAIDILAGKTDNDLNEDDLLQLKTFIDTLINKWAQDDIDNYNETEYDMNYCVVCCKVTKTKIIYSESAQVLECSECGNYEVFNE